jgi:hypothetical protein
MSWTVRIEDENGNLKKEMPNELMFSDIQMLYNKQFRLLRYIDPFGDTTFNALMFNDLIADLTELRELLPKDKEQIDTIINYAKECSNSVHTY